MITARSLIRHCELYAPDAWLMHNFFACVLPLAQDEAARDVLLGYYHRRTRHKSFKRGSWTHNNHGRAFKPKDHTHGPLS